MEWGPYIKDRIPSVIRGLTAVIASNVAKPAEQEDPTPLFMEQRLAILSKYQDDLKTVEEAPGETFIRPAAVAKCPYCNLEEKAGVVRNHLLFVAQECKEDKLGPATGGMVPKAKAITEEFIAEADHMEAPSHIRLVIQLAAMKAHELLSRLDWIHTCDEARDAATAADEMWHRAAKATQMYYAETPDSPYR